MPVLFDIVSSSHSLMSSGLRQLSEREQEILQLVATGLSNQQIASQLNISSNTVKVHLRNIFGKIGAASRTEATMYAVRAGLVEIERPVLNNGIAPADQSQLPSPTSFPSVPETAAGSTAPSVLTPSTTHAQGIEDTEALMVEPLALPTPATRGTTALGGRALTTKLIGLIGIVIAVAAFGLWISRPKSPSADSTSVDSAQNNISQQRWHERASMLSPRAGFATARMEDFVYAIGGEDERGVQDKVERYDPRSSTWVVLTKKPTRVTDVKAAVLGGKIYIPGGRRSQVASDISDVLEVYDPRTDSWAQLTNLPAPRSGYGLAAMEGRLYLFGGWDGRAYRSEVLEYNPDSGTWGQRTAMPTARAFFDIGVVEGNVFIFGGQNEHGPLTNNERYIPSAERNQPWVTRAPLPSPRSHFGVAVAANNIYILGGAEDNRSPLQYDIRTDGWRSFPAPPQLIGSQPGVVQRDVTILGLGGKLGPKGYSDAVQEYQALYTIVLPSQ